MRFSASSGRLLPWGRRTTCAGQFPRKSRRSSIAERKTFVYGDAASSKSTACIATGVYRGGGTVDLRAKFVDFANYAFNKAHAVCYAVVAYQTAYLKCHYPRRVHGGADDLRSGLRHQNFRIHRRMPGAWGSGSAAPGHQSLPRTTFTVERRRHPLRPRRREERWPRPHPFHGHARTGGGRPLSVSLEDFAGTDAGGGR